jgi:hypothetical protein
MTPKPKSICLGEHSSTNCTESMAYASRPTVHGQFNRTRAISQGLTAPIKLTAPVPILQDRKLIIAVSAGGRRATAL